MRYTRGTTRAPFDGRRITLLKGPANDVREVNRQVHAIGVALAVALVAAMGFAATGAMALGSEILAPAIGAIEENMPADAQETSGVLDVMDDVEERLDEVLPDDVELPEQADDGLEHVP